MSKCNEPNLKAFLFLFECLVSCHSQIARLLIFDPILMGQILFLPVCDFRCKLINKFDYVSIFWTLVTKVTSAQLFMHKNA